jgi:hypothetical protein
MSELAELVISLVDEKGRSLSLENIGGSTKRDKVVALVLWFERRGRLYDLVEACREARPYRPWPILDNTLPPLL